MCNGINVLMINGGQCVNGNTSIALKKIGKNFSENGIDRKNTFSKNN